MRAEDSELRGIKVVEPTVFEDQRGFFFESYNAREFLEAVGFEGNFVQDNHSRSVQHVLRGLHYQVNQPQAKLVRVVVGEVFDVAVDIRKSSPQFGRWVGVRLSAQNKRQLWIPVGFAHGFLVLSKYAEVLYKTTNYYSAENERCITWNDPDIGIKWPTDPSLGPILSPRDQEGSRLKAAEIFL